MSNRDNSGALFINTRKQQENHPDFQGPITIDGVKYFLSGWAKQGQNGPYTSLSIKRADDKYQGSQQHSGGQQQMQQPIPMMQQPMQQAPMGQPPMNGYVQNQMQGVQQQQQANQGYQEYSQNGMEPAQNPGFRPVNF